MPIAIPPLANSPYEAHYDPHHVLKHPEFRVLTLTDPEMNDKSANISCAYNPAHEVHMINKPVPKAGPGEAIVHVRATGICG